MRPDKVVHIIRQAFRIAVEDGSIEDHCTIKEAEEAERIALASPDLLDALRDLVAECDRLGNALSAKGQGATVLGMRVRKAREAIAWAEGK